MLSLVLWRKTYLRRREVIDVQEAALWCHRLVLPLGGAQSDGHQLVLQRVEELLRDVPVHSTIQWSWQRPERSVDSIKGTKTTHQMRWKCSMHCQILGKWAGEPKQCFKTSLWPFGFSRQSSAECVGWRGTQRRTVHGRRHSRQCKSNKTGGRVCGRMLTCWSAKNSPMWKHSQNALCLKAPRRSAVVSA